MTYSDKVKKALSLAETADDINLIREKISKTDSINRRTIEGRKLTEELLQLTHKRLIELIEQGMNPF